MSDSQPELAYVTLLEVSRHMSPEVKWYTNIYVILTYTARETHVLFGLFIPEIHFFGRGLKFL